MTIVGSSSLIAANLEKNCFTQHLKEAVQLNQARGKIYSLWTNGESKKISNKLIRLELLTTIPSRFFDLLAKKYQKQGLTILCDEFVPMANAPVIQTHLDPPTIKFSDVTPPNWKKVKSEVKALVKKNSIEEAILVLEVELSKFNNLPYYCMYKHLLESLIRSLSLMPKYAMWDKQHNSNALKLSKTVFKFQLMGMGLGVGLDKDASSVQEMGVKIICQDVPKIAPLK